MRLLFTLLVVLLPSLAAAQFAPVPVQLYDPETGLPVTAIATDGTVGQTAQNTGPSIKCYASAAGPAAVTSGQDQYVWCTTKGAPVVSLVTADGTPIALVVDPEDEDTPTLGTTKGIPSFFLADETSSDTLSEGQTGFARMTLDRMLRSVPSPSNVNGGTPIRYTSAGATEDEHNVCTAACNIYSITITNTNAAARYLRCENDTNANTVPGSETPELDLAIPGAAAGAGFTVSFPVGAYFTTAATCWLVTGAAQTDVAEVAANEIKVFYTVKQ